MPVKNLHVRRAVGILTVALGVLAAAVSMSAAQQPIKDGWVTMKIHSMFITEDALSGSNIDVGTFAKLIAE